MVNLLDVVNELAISEAPLQKLPGRAPAMTVKVPFHEGYIWPDLKDYEDPEGARVFLVQAAGAVGKTEASRALAAHLRWPIIEASQMQVGDYTLTGQVIAGFGMESDFIPSVARGQAGLIIDSLDEAHLKAGTSNFQAFLNNIAWFADGSSSRRPNIVLFSRPDTGELVKTQFEEAGISLALATIDFFDEDKAARFVSSYLSYKSLEFPDADYHVAQSFPVPFAELLHAQMKEIASSLLDRRVTDLSSAWGEVYEFLGYAPVLAVLAEFLAVPNPHAELHSRVGVKLSSHRILLQIVREILEREQGKFQRNKSAELHAKLAPGTDWLLESEVYSADEQAVRLVARHLQVDVAVRLPASVPIEIREEYERAARQFTADHPFLADRDALNIVFGDFIRAKAAVDATCRVSLAPSPMTMITDPGPFFARFVHEFSPRTSEGDASIDEGLVPNLLRSHLKTLQKAPHITFTYMQDESRCQLALEQEDRLESVEFTAQNPSGVSFFPDQLSRGLVLCQDAVVLGRRRGSFILGPATTIIAAEISIDAEILSVDPKIGKQEAPSVIFGIEKVEANYLSRVDSYGPGSFRVSGRKVWPRLQPYVVQSVRPDPVSMQDYVHLRALVKSFRQGAGASPSVYSELLEQRIVKASAVRIQLLDGLQSRGIVSKERDHYYLSTDVLSRYGMSWGALVDGSPTDSVLEFIALVRAGSS